MDTRPDGPNPGLAEAINTTLRNNVITAVAQVGGRMGGCVVASTGDRLGKVMGWRGGGATGNARAQCGLEHVCMR